MTPLKINERPEWACISTARKALSRWDLGGMTALRHVTWGENATWKITAGNACHALRIYRPGRWTREQVMVEHALMESLGEKFGAMAPVPGKDGETLQEVPGTPWVAAMFPWSGGRFIFNGLSVKNIGRLGNYMGKLHRHLLKQPPVETSCPVASSRSWNRYSILLYPIEVLARKWPEFSQGKPSPARLNDYGKALLADWDALGPQIAMVHADLHVGNLKWSSDRLHPIDFDDCGMAPLPYDIAIPANCFAGLTTGTERLMTFLDSYNAAAPARISLGELRLFMAIRRIWQMGWCCDRPEVFTHEYLSRRCEAGLEVLDGFMKP